MRLPFAAMADYQNATTDGFRLSNRDAVVIGQRLQAELEDAGDFLAVTADPPCELAERDLDDGDVEDVAGHGSEFGDCGLIAPDGGESGLGVVPSGGSDGSAGGLSGAGDAEFPVIAQLLSGLGLAWREGAGAQHALDGAECAMYAASGLSWAAFGGESRPDGED
jgi:hypothetical protein